MAAAVPGAPILYPKPCAQLDYITVYWQPAPGEVTSYTITCAPISYSRTVPANYNQIELHGLSPGIKYAFSIYATNRYGNGPTANFVPMSVGTDPSNPFELYASTASNTSAYITWNFSSIYATEPRTEHFIITAIPSTVGAAPKLADWTFSNQTNIMMPDLSTGVTYAFLVQAANDIRYSSYSTLSNYIRIQIYWYPTQLDDIQCWYDASELIYANGRTIKSWPDRAGRSYLFNPPTYVYPTIRVAGLNGLNVTTFNQLAGLQLSPLLTSTTQSFFAVSRQSGGANFKVFGSYTSEQYIGYFGGKKQIISLDDNPMSIGVNSDTEWDLISMVLQQNISNNFYWYGSRIATNAMTNIVDSLTFNGIGNASNCEIAEVIFYNRNLITEERQVVEGYLAWKWGLQTKLPPDHPWFYVPPPLDYTTKVPPKPFTSVTVTDPTPTTFTINWIGGKSVYDTPTTLIFLLNDIPTIPISVIDGKAVFANLDPGADYVVIITATNRFGSTSSTPITATTTPSKPTINGFTNVTSSTITVGWTGGQGATSYIYYFNGAPITPSIDNGTTNKKATFTGLSPNTFYTIIVVAVNRAGSTSSDPADTQLAPVIPVPRVDLNLPFSLNLSWLPCPGAQSYSYIIEPSAGVVTTLTGTSIYFSNLETNTEYTITIIAINGYGRSSSIPLPVTTIPADLITTLTQTTCSSFTIVWEPLVSFVYTYSLVNNSVTTFVSSVFTPLTISSLLPNQTYTIQVWETKSTTVIYASSITVITYPNPTSSLTVTSINTNGFTLNWKGGDQASSFLFSLDGGTTVISTVWSPKPYLTSKSGSAIFTNLSTGATFNNIIIYSQNIGGVSFSDAYPTVTLLPGACRNPTPSLFGQRTFTVNWQPPLGATSIVYGGSLQPSFTNGTLGPAVYASLIPGTVYSTSYTPYNLNGTQAGQTTSLLVKTQTDKPTNFQHSATSLSTLYFTWSGVFGAEYYKYVINGVLSPISTSQSSITVSSISTSTDYNVAIVAYDTGWSLGPIILSTYSNYTLFITQPAIPTGQKISSITVSSFEISWDPVPSTIYTILVGSTVSGPYTSPTTISSLIGNSTYTVTIIATNPGGSTTSSMTVKTGPVAPYNISTTYITDHEMLITWSGTDGASSITIFYGPFSTTVATPVTQPFRLYPLSSNTTYIITIDAISPICVTRSGSISPATGPGIASGLAASNVQNTQFTLSWLGSEGASSLLFHYNNLSTLSTPAIASPTIIRNLSANTTYLVSIDSINPIFTTSSNQISVRTGPVPAGNISTQNITDHEIAITWTGTDGASSITIYYGPFSTTVPAPVTQPYIIRPLSSNTTYIISIDATNPIFNTSSQQITSRTGPTQVTGIVASNVQNSQFTLSWSGAEGASSLLFHYNNLSTLSTPAIQSPTTITNLSANTVYIVSIDAINPIFTTSSNTISVRTGPVPARNISISTVTDTTVDIYWDGTEGASSIVIHYGPDILVFPAPVNRPVTLSTLSSNKEYVISIDAVSPIFITSSQQITTKTGPGIVSGITASNITNSQFNLAWSGAQGASSLLFHYNNLSTLSSASIPSPTLLTNLSGNTTYIVSIDAINPIFTTSSNTISVLTGPVTPYNLVQSEITNIKFLLAWSGGNGASSYTFHWGTSSLVYNAQTISNPVLIANLSTGTTYDVYIEATSPIFNAISEHYQLSTLTIIPTTAITSISASSITDTTLILKWTGGVNASSFYFYYAGLTVVSSAITLTDNILVTGLTDSAIYSFYMQGVNLLSTTTSNTITVHMGPAPATNLTFSNITDSRLTVSWQGTHGASTLTLYCGLQNFTFTPAIAPPYTFVGLEPYTNYPVRIDSITHVYTNPSQTVTVRTGPGEFIFMTSDVQSKQLTLSWTGGLGASSILFTYGNQFIISSATLTSPLIITGLTPNTNYPIRMEAINSTYTTSSVTLNQLTGPAPATNITITNIKDVQFDVNWLNAQGASSLTFRYNSQTLSVNTPVSSPYTISSLQPFTSYTVSIDAVNPIFTTSSMQTSATTGAYKATGLSYSDVTNTSFKLYWTGGTQGASSIQFVYNGNSQTYPITQTSPITLTNLTGNTTYNTYINAINSTYTTSSNSISVLTGPVTPFNLTATNITNALFKLGWSGGQGASSYTFHYNTQQVTYSAAAVTNPVSIVSLSTATGYNVYIEATNSIYNAVSQIFNVSTLAVIPPLPATNITAGSVTANTFLLYWQGADNASSLTFYIGGFTPIVSSATVNSPILVTGLTQNTQYPVYIDAVNILNTATSNTVNITTAPNIPNPSLVPNTVSASTFQATWTNSSGITYSYTLNGGGATNIGQNPTIPYTVSTLTQNTPYTFSLIATNSASQSSNSSFQVTTPPSPPNASVQTIAQNSFAITWTPVGGIAYHYKLNGGAQTNAGSPPLNINNSIIGDTTYPFLLIATGLTASVSTYLNVLTLPVPQIPSVHNGQMYGTYFQIFFQTPVNGNYYYYNVNNGGPSNYVSPYNYVQPLTPNTSYTLTLSTINASGSSNASMNFTTGPRRPDNLYADNLQTNSFMIHWTGYDNPSYYRVFYNNTSQDTANGVTYLTCNQGLSPQTYYGVYVVAINQNGFSNNSDSINVLTNPSPPNPYQDLSKTNLSSLEVTWDLPGNVTYNCQFNNGSIQTDIWPPQPYYNLPAGQTFQFRLWAKNPNTNPPTQISPVSITVGTAPGEATNLRYSNLSHTGTANLAWQGGTGATSANVVYDNANHSFSSGGLLTGLMPNWNYRLSVSTINQYGVTNSVLSTLTTYPEWPSPQNFSVDLSNLTDTTEYFNVIGVPGSGNTGGAYYGNGGDNSNLNCTISYSIDNGTTKIISGNPYQITSLLPNTTYTIQFYLYNSAGFSLPSFQTSFTTKSPRPTVSVLSLVGSSCSTLSLSWSGLQYATTIDVYVNDSIVFQGLSGSATTYLASSLTQATYYQNIFIIARNNAFAGANNYSNRIEGLTAALQPIQNTTKTNNTQLEMSFTINPNIIYTYSITNSGGNTRGPESLTTSPFTISTLSGNSLYTLRLYDSYNGLTAVTSTIIGTGPNEETLTLVSYSYSSFTISWTGNVGASYYIIKYNGNVPPGDPGGQITGTSRAIATNPNTAYSVYLAEFNSYGSSFSNTVTFTTPIAPPPTPSVTQTGASDSVIQVRLNNDIGGVTYYWTKDGNSITPSNLTFDQGITPNQSYILTVYGRNSTGPSATTTITVYSGPEKPYNLNTTTVSGANITFRWAGAGATNFYVGYGNDAVVVAGGTFSYALNNVNGPYTLSVQARKNLPNGIEGVAQSGTSYTVTAVLPDGVYNGKIPGSYNEGSFLGNGIAPITELYGLSGTIVERVQYPSLIKNTIVDMSGFSNINYADRQGPTCIDVDWHSNARVVSNNGTLINASGRYTLGTPGRFPGATAITTGSDGFLYIVSTNGNIYKVAAQSGTIIASRNIGTALYGVCDYNNDYVLASSGNTVYRVKRDLSDANGAFNLVNNNSLRQMTRDSNGNVYVSASTEIWKIDKDGNYGRVITGIANTGPIGIGPEGCVWFGQSGNFGQLVQASLGFLTRVSNNAN